jgi:hypothetical protein
MRAAKDVVGSMRERGSAPSPTLTRAPRAFVARLAWFRARSASLRSLDRATIGLAPRDREIATRAARKDARTRSPGKRRTRGGRRRCSCARRTVMSMRCLPSSNSGGRWPFGANEHRTSIVPGADDRCAAAPDWSCTANEGDRYRPRCDKSHSARGAGETGGLRGETSARPRIAREWQACWSIGDSRASSSGKPC